MDHQITYDLLNELWTNLVTNSLVEEEQDVMFTWLQESTQSQAELNVNIQDLQKFYIEKISILEDEDITSSGFSCFESLFCIINEKQGKLQKLKIEKKKKIYHVNYQGFNDSDNEDEKYEYIN